MSAGPIHETSDKSAVRDFWEAGPCGAKHARASEGTSRFYTEVEDARDRLEPFIARYARFGETRDREVLEIGTGLGTDLVRFARAGARVTGIDLTERAVDLARRRLEQEGLPGRVVVGDAERLPFADDSFDVVYSWGVLHHTPNTEQAVGEALRVLKPTGRLCVMLYGRRSWVAFALWGRYALLRGRPWHSLSRVVSEHMESAGTKAYTRSELERMFAGAPNLRVEHVGTPYDRRVAGPLARVTGPRMGWFMVIRADGRAA